MRLTTLLIALAACFALIGCETAQPPTQRAYTDQTAWDNQTGDRLLMERYTDEESPWHLQGLK